MDYGLDELHDGISCLLVDTSTGSVTLGELDGILALKETEIDAVAQGKRVLEASFLLRCFCA